jgi:hypothetical protein
VEVTNGRVRIQISEVDDHGSRFATVYCYVEFYRPEILTLETSYNTVQSNAAMPISDLQYDRKYDSNHIRTTTVIRDIRIGV